MNNISDYYTNQAVTGISGFRGSRYQRGGGFLTWLYNLGLPVLKFLGKQVAASSLSTASDMLDGQSFKESAKKNFKQTGKNTVKYLAEKIAGSGIKRRKKRSTVIKRKKVPKRTTVKRKTSKCKRRLKRCKGKLSQILRYGAL